MRTLRALQFGLPLALACASPAAAQTVPGQSVTVNLSAAGSRMLLYPGGKYARVQHTLLQPGDRDPNAPIHLHMPYRHAVARHVAPRAPKLADATTHVVPAAPMSTTAPAAGPPPSDSAAGLTVMDSPLGGGAPTAPPPQLRASKPARLASVESPPRTTDIGGSRPRAVLFPAGQSDPAPVTLDQVKAMAGDLNASLTSPASRVQLMAYGGPRGDKSSDARRLSLKRALIVRQLLIDDGVPSERIDVRAMGGADSGPPDRVDIFVRA